MINIIFLDLEVSESGDKVFDYGAIKSRDEMLHTGSDDKLQTDELNNPLNDAIKAQELFYDEINAFETLCLEMQRILYLLLHESPYFSGFFEYLSFHANDDLIALIRNCFLDKICDNAPLSNIIAQLPIELTYALAMVSATEKHSILPRWVLIQFPKVDYVLRILLNTPCMQCRYCNEKLNPIN